MLCPLIRWPFLRKILYYSILLPAAPLVGGSSVRLTMLVIEWAIKSSLCHTSLIIRAFHSVTALDLVRIGISLCSARLMT